jgi:phosphatidylserine/phosphatidylglycerophosphate/cardiolipin synthase-like enzyme
MRTPITGDAVKVRAIAGTHTVLFAFDVAADLRGKLLGFALRREDGDEGYWLKASKVFPSVVPQPPVGSKYSTLEHPVQTLLWGDYTAKPGRTYTYTIRPLLGKPKNLVAGTDVTIEVTTEPEYDPEQKHGVWFNRGAVASQAYADRFFNEPPPEPDNPAHPQTAWLSRGLLEACLQFIDETPKGHALRVAAYEFTYPPVLAALKAASARGVDVQIVYEAGKETVKGERVNTAATTANIKAIKATKFTAKTKFFKRTKRKAIPHNKFIVRLDKNDKATSVWSGSTNFTPSGFLGQTNVGHRVDDEDVAAQFLSYWTLLADDPEPASLEGDLAELTPEPELETLIDPGIATCLFSPRSSAAMLDWYAERIRRAESAVLYTGGFGVSEAMAEAIAVDKDFLRFVLLEKPPTKKTKGLLGPDRDVLVVYGNVLGEIWVENKKGELTLRRPIPGFEVEKWFFKQERHFRKTGNIFFVHTKILIVDPLSEDPLVFSGSANFSDSSLRRNDENMLLIRGNTRVADIYLTEIDRILRHFYFRDIAAELHGKDDGKAKFLAEDSSWLAPYYKKNTLKSRRREMFF